MHCEHCGATINGEQSTCYRCGAAIEKKESVASENGWLANDAHSKAFAAAGFFGMPAGFILYGIFKNRSPKRAKSALNGSIAGAILWGMLYTIYFILEIAVELL